MSLAPDKKAATIMPQLRRNTLPVRASYVEPSTAFEKQLAELWREIMNVDMVGSQDDYFDLGGDSLMATELFLELERWYGVRLATSDILIHSTVAKIAAILGRESRPETNRCLIPLQPEGAEPPLFFIHDMSGGVMSYRHLLRRLGASRKVFGLLYPGPIEGAMTVMSFPEMAAIYVEAIRSVWPQGPYYVVGFSMGAQIAFETANQLATVGGDVSLLALIDGPTRKGKVSGLRREARKLSRGLFNLAEVKVASWPRYLLGVLGQEVVRVWKKERRQRHDRPPNFAVLIGARSGQYSPLVFRGAAKVLRTTDGAEYFNRKYIGWDEYVSGPIEVFDISADHSNLMTEPRVALVTAYLESWIAEADLAGRARQRNSDL
jgi:thioesterase domain-containing protein/acyl carrier protein